MTPVNIQRDGTFIDLAAARIDMSSASLITSGTDFANSDGAVHADFASASHNYAQSVTVVSGSIATFGVFMKQPVRDRQPYRIKMGGTLVTNQGTEALVAVIGYGPASLTGTDDTIALSHYFPFITSIDEMVIIEAQLEGDTYFGRPLFIGIGISDVNAGTLFADMSVQNLGVKPPTMQNAIS